MFKAEIVYYSSTLDVGSGNEGFFLCADKSFSCLDNNVKKYSIFAMILT